MKEKSEKLLLDVEEEEDFQYDDHEKILLRDNNNASARPSVVEPEQKSEIELHNIVPVMPENDTRYL